MTMSAGLYDKLYLNTGTYASPTLVEIDGIGDVDAQYDRNAIEVKLRRFDMITNLPGLRKRSFSFPIVSEPDAAVCVALRAAIDTGSTKELFFFYKYIDDGGQPDTGSKAVRAQVIISKFSESQKLEDLDVNEVECQIAANLLTGSTEPVSDYTAA